MCSILCNLCNLAFPGLSQSMTDAPVMVWENREASADFIDIGYKHFHSSQQEASSSQGTGDQCK